MGAAGDTGGAQSTVTVESPGVPETAPGGHGVPAVTVPVTGALVPPGPTATTDRCRWCRW